MIHLAKIILVLLFLLSFAQVGVCENLRVLEKTFCLKMNRPACELPAISTEVPLSSIQNVEGGVARLYFWTSIEVNNDRNIVHVWSASNRSDVWAEHVHVSTSDRFVNLAREFLGYLRELYFIRHKTDPSVHSVQGVFLDLEESPRFRTYSAIRAFPGTYTVEVRNLEQKVVPGGEAKTITIVP